MTKYIARIARVALGLAALTGAPASAQSNIQFTVSGNSTVRGWTCTVQGSAQVTRGGGAAVRGFDQGVSALVLTVPVNDFVCPEDEMREHLREAMRATEFSTITFRMESYQPSGQGAVLTGTLTILAATNPVTLPVFLTPGAGGVQVTGNLPLDMTTYGVQPPVVMGGLLRVRPQIRIEFEGTVSQ